MTEYYHFLKELWPFYMYTNEKLAKNSKMGFERPVLTPLEQFIFFMFISFFFRGHQEILKVDGKCLQYDPVPLVLVKDIMNYMPQMKYMFATQLHQQGSQTKRMKQS